MLDHTGVAAGARPREHELATLPRRRQPIMTSPPHPTAALGDLTPDQIDYLKERTTGDIVWPPDAQLRCYPLPSSYAVVRVEERQVRPRVMTGTRGAPYLSRFVRDSGRSGGERAG